MSRKVEIVRRTRETDISLVLELDGSGKADLACPIGFMVHMLETFAKHGLFDLNLRCSGDLHVDQHHLVEDIGIVLGLAFSKALGDKRGIRRVGSCLFPMDETLARAAVDLSGRPFLVFAADLSGQALVSASPLTPGAPGAAGYPASFQTDTVEDFWLAFATNAACALHLDVLRGRSDHHRIEALFKAAARALREASEIDPRAQSLIPSTKGVLA